MEIDLQHLEGQPVLGQVPDSELELRLMAEELDKPEAMVNI